MTENDAAPRIGFAPRVRKSPFFAATRRHGCKGYTVYNHMFFPQVYDSPEAEFWRLINDVMIWDVACERQVEITGPDAARFTQLLTPRNLSTCAVGQCKYVLITAADGGVINDPVLLRLGEDRFWLSLADGDVALWAQGVATYAGMDVAIGEPDVSPLQVQGPKSPDVMRDLFGGWIEDLRYYWFREAELDGIPLVVSRTGWSSERGYEIFLCDGSRGDDLWEAVMEAGKPYGIGAGVPSQIRRIEGGMISYGADATREENPFELGLDRLVDLDQEADFIGKPALKRIKAEGVKRRLVGLELALPPLAANEEPWPVLCADGRRGKLTSGLYSPRLEKNIAMAILPIEDTAPGTAVTVQAPSGDVAATVAPLPFYDVKKTLASGAGETR